MTGFAFDAAETLPPLGTMHSHRVDPCADGGLDEVLYQSQHTRVFRRRLPAGTSVICKEILGPHAAEQQRHERNILARLSAIEGVPRLASDPASDHVIAMEDTNGVPLLEAVRVQRLEERALLTFAQQLTQIIVAVHRCGVLHKDINPANILVWGPLRKPLLIDFHLATTFAEEQPGFTHHRDIAGTLAYLAPEQTGRTGRTVDQRADLYALGATLYELATGHPPFAGDDPLQLIHDHLARVPTPPIELNASLWPGLSEMILRLLEKEPDRRYQSAEGLAHDLSRLVEGQARGDRGTFRLGERDFALRLLPPSRLIGRQVELAALQAAFHNALNGKRHGVLVAGAPGVGKTALLNELRPIVTAQRGWFVSGKFDQYRHDASTAVVQALRAVGRLLLAEPETELAQQRARILDALGTSAGLLTAYLPEFVLLLGVQPTTVTASDPIETETRLRQTTLEMLRAVVSPARPLVMILDDLQWASPSSIRFIDALLTEENLRGLLLVGAYREAEVDATHPLSAMLPRWERLDATAPLLQLKNLPQADLGSLLSEMLRLSEVQAASLADTVSLRTNGNPYDTVELVNGLRRDGALLLCEEGWVWDETTIQRYVGQGSVVDLLTARIGRLPPEAQSLLQLMACLGGELKLGLLQAATGLSSAMLEGQLTLSLEEGLVMLELEQGDDSTVRFRHDRVQQAAYGGLDTAQRRVLHLTLARRLVMLPEFVDRAAEQYLTAFDVLDDPDECRRVASLFQKAADQVRRSANYVPVERYLAAAIALLKRTATPQDEPVLAALEIQRHAALYSLGRLEEADQSYRAIEQHSRDPVALAEAAGIQVSSLTNRGAMSEALALGFDRLRQLGSSAPSKDFAAEIPGQLEEFLQWVETLSVDADRRRPEITDRRVIAMARLATQMMPAALYSDPTILAWLILDSQRMWAEHGPCAALVPRLCNAIIVTINMRKDYCTGYRAMRHVLAVSEARGYEPASSQARFLISISSMHWFEPLENVAPLAQRAREGLLQGGELQDASFTYHASIPALLHTAPTLESCASEIESGFAFAQRTGNEFISNDFRVFQQLLRTLRNETETPGGFTDKTFDEATYLASVASMPMSVVHFHVQRALSAALFGDSASLSRHAAAAMRFLPYIGCGYPCTLAYLLQAQALADEIKAIAPEQRAPLLAELDACQDWLALRAQDAPSNFLHLRILVEAERAWAVGEDWKAACAFDAALREVEVCQRPWHHALITERAGLFHLTRGLARTGRLLLADARRLYAAWGARAKVRELERVHAFLRTPLGLPRSEPRRQTVAISADSIDLLGVLRASQVLSKETSIERLKLRLGELLGTMTGATKVLLVLRSDETQEWFLPATADEGAVPISVAEAGARGLLPLAAFRYAERTREPLLLEDATRDDRFAQDPYLAGLERCSLLVVPILNQGIPRAVLLLENRLSRGTFSADRLDAVNLITGQLAVSLDNALLYASLERKVTDRTQELASSLALLNATLDSTTDGIVAVQLSKKGLCCNAPFAVMWGLPSEMLARQNSDEIIAFVLPQLRNPERFFQLHTASVADPSAETFDVLELKDGRIFERYARPQRVDGKSVGLVVNFRDITARKLAETELESIHRELVDASRRGGMAEIATNVLHNVGNVLNSVNVSANLAAEMIKKSKVASLARVAALLRANEPDLGAFISADPRGKQLPGYLEQLAEHLLVEQKSTVQELDSLRANIDHIKEIVAMQQNYAKVSGVREIIDVRDLVEDSLRMNVGALDRHGVELIRELADVPLMNVDKHRILQILVNLVRNAKYACDESGRSDKRLTVRVVKGDQQIKISVIDNGVGIPPENLTRIFNHGFSTRKGGHGFGLHSGALAAKELGGSLTVYSDGIGHGASFTLELPYQAQEHAHE